MRLSTIAIDSNPGLAPVQWSAAWVMRRMVEAYSVERRLPQARRRLLIASAWPKMAVEFFDLVGRADDDRKDRFASWEYAGRLGVSAADISRMEAAHSWLAILAPYPQERLCLAQWAAAGAYRKSVRSLLAKRGWARSTFYRYASAGAHVIALELTRQGLPVA